MSLIHSNAMWHVWDDQLNAAIDPLSMAIAALMRERGSYSTPLWYTTGRLRRTYNHFEIGVFDRTRGSSQCRLHVFTQSRT